MKGHFQLQHFMSDSRSRIPKEVLDAWLEFCRTALRNGFGVLAMIALDINSKDKNVPMIVQLSPNSTENPHMIEMCDDISDAFKAMAERLKQ